MLTFLSISNYALIRSQEIDFTSGFSVITGETGAGKSILLGALGLVLGNRADATVAFDPEKKCVVEAHFSTVGFDFSDFYVQNDLDSMDNGLLIIRREILPGGKSRAFINDTPVTLNQVKELAQNLVDIHSQHQTLLLNSSRFQCRLLDSYSSDSGVMDSYRQSYRSYSDLKRGYELLAEKMRKSHDEKEYRQFLLDEIEQLHLQNGEQRKMEQALESLSKSEQIKSTLVESVEALEGDDFSLCSRIEQIVRSLRKIAPYHSGVETQMERWDSLNVELGDLSRDLQSWAEEGDLDPSLKELYEDRLDKIYRLEKKHHVDDVDDLIRIREDLRNELDGLEESESELESMKQSLSEKEKDLVRKGNRLSEERKKTAHILEKAILGALSELGMSKSVLQIKVESGQDWGMDGGDKVEFLFSANTGSQAREISKVASGGELSRLMLAIKSVIHQNSLIGTLILDEIDTGVSGKVAAKVAAMMKDMGRYMQVIAITHLPQIAAAARTHFYVSKKEEEGRTVSRIRQLDEKEHLQEIAMMLSNDEVTEAALKAAEALVNA